MALNNLMADIKSVELMGRWSNPSLLSLWPGEVAPDRTAWHLNCVQTIDLRLTELLETELFDHLTGCKRMTV